MPVSSWLLPYLFLPLIILNFGVIGENHYAYLAHAFLNQNLAFVQLPPKLSDLTYFDGHFYWLPGLPLAVALTPFIWLFGLNFQEGFAKFFLNIANFWLIFQIGKSLKLSPQKSFWLAIFYIFGSTYTPAATIPFSVYTSAIVTNCAILLAIYEFLNKKRWFVIGTALALATLTRYTAVTASLFFLFYLLGKPLNYPKIFKFLVPIILPIILIGFYNQRIFGNFWQSGYGYRLITQEATQRRDYGLFSLRHIPANLYYMLLKTPDPVLSDSTHVFKPPYLKFNPYGMSLFLLSPILVLIFKTNFKEKFIKASLATILTMAVPIITYYGIGYQQIGYWHALDFYPFLLILLILAAKKINLRKLKFLVISGVIITWFFLIEMLTGF